MSNTDKYRLKVFRGALEKHHKNILSQEDDRLYKRVSGMYDISFFTVFASLPLNLYYGRLIRSIPEKAP